MADPVKIKNVHIKGNNRIKSVYFEKELSAGLKIGTSDGFGSIEEAQAAVINLNQQMQRSGLFKSVNASMNVPNTIDPVNGESRGANLRAVEVQFEVIENIVPKLEMETNVKPGSRSNDVFFSVTGALRSPFGYGETGKVAIGTSKMGMNTYDLEVKVPHINQRLDDLTLSGTLTDEDKTFYQSHKEKQSALSTKISSKDGAHELSAAMVFRDEVPRAHQVGENLGIKDATGGILHAASSSSKLSLKYIGTPTDTRDSSFNPTKGSLLRTFRMGYDGLFSCRGVSLYHYCDQC